jgi:lysophospholipase L1-like esterase
MIGRLTLVVCSVLVTLFLLEIGCRLVRGPATLLDWKNFVLANRLQMSGQNIGNRFAYDPLLGYVQRPGYTNALMTYDADGFRVMPPPPAGASDGPPILATGDSYTQGDEVGNDLSWPAQLQGLLKRRTINAGVAAYGFDQIVMRTEQLVPKVKPAAIVLGFIADDVRRSEMSRLWGTEKPYFTLKGDGVELHNVPVPPSPDPRDTLDFWQRAFGWSVLLDTVLIHQGLQYEWLIDHRRATPAGTGERLACPLLRRIAALGVPTLVVAQYDFYVWRNAEFAAAQRRVSQAVLKCAEAAGLATLDLYDQTEKAVRERGQAALYLAWHPSPAGYALIAEGIAAELERRGMIPR